MSRNTDTNFELKVNIRYIVFFLKYVLWHVMRTPLSLFFFASGVLGIRGEWIFIFRELGSTGNYFRRASLEFWGFRELCQKAKKKERPPFCLIFKMSPASRGLIPQTPLVK